MTKGSALRSLEPVILRYPMVSSTSDGGIGRIVVRQKKNVFGNNLVTDFGWIDFGVTFTNKSELTDLSFNQKQVDRFAL